MKIALLGCAIGSIVLSLGGCATPTTSMVPVATHCELAALTPTTSQAHDTLVWALLSPRMPYALQEWQRMKTVARDAGFEVMSFRDPRVPRAEWGAASTSMGLQDLHDVPPMPVETAQRCQMLNHAPTVMLTRCGRVHPWPVRGVMTDDAWRHVLASRRADLERLPCP